MYSILRVYIWNLILAKLSHDMGCGWDKFRDVIILHKYSKYKKILPSRFWIIASVRFPMSAVYIKGIYLKLNIG